MADGFKYSLFSDVLFPENHVALSDYAVLYKVLTKANHFYYLHDCLYFYCRRNDSLSVKLNCDARMKCYLLALERYEFLRKCGYRVSELGQCVMSLGLIRKSDISESREKERLYCAIGKKTIRSNLSMILRERKCPKSVKVAFVLASVGLYNWALKLKIALRK